MQNIPLFLNLEMAKLVPICMVAGKAGGTTIVIKSKALRIIVVLSTPSRIKLIEEARNPKAAIIASTPMNRKESR